MRKHRRGSRAPCGAWNERTLRFMRLHRWTRGDMCEFCGRTRQEVARRGRDTDKQRDAAHHADGEESD